MDYLDTATNVLYCSFDCARRYAWAKVENIRKVDQAEYDKNHDDNVLSGDHWGAMCSCGNTYNSF